MRSALYLLLGFLLGVSIAAPRAQLSVSVFGISKHSKSGFCEMNPGFGFNYALNKEWSLTAVRYKNSLCVDSTAVGAVYLPLHYGHFSFGAALLRVTGYQEQPLYIPIPVISYDLGSYAIDAIAGAKDKEFVIGAGLRIPIQ